MKKPEKKKTTKTKFEQVCDYVRSMHDQIDGLVNTHELDTYILEGSKIDGTKVMESEDITPEQVAILGAHSAIVDVSQALVAIENGEEAKATALASSKKRKDIKGVVVVDGEAMDIKKLPKDVLDSLKQIIADNED